MFMDWGINVGENLGGTQYSRKQSLTTNETKWQAHFFTWGRGGGFLVCSLREEEPMNWLPIHQRWNQWVDTYLNFNSWVIHLEIN
jgi:hypothetical protein